MSASASSVEDPCLVSGTSSSSSLDSPVTPIVSFESAMEIVKDKSAAALQNVFSQENIMYPLHLAVAHSHLSIARTILRSFPSYVDHLDENGKTAMHVVVENSLKKIPSGEHVPLLKLLFKHNSKALSIADKQGRKPLHLAALHADEETFTYLINRKYFCVEGHPIDEVDAKGFSPFHLAVAAGRHDIVKTFLDNSDDSLLESYDKKMRTPFFSACRVDLQMVKILWASSPLYLEVTDVDEMSPLLAALNEGLVDVAVFLLEEGALFAKCEDLRLTEKGLATLKEAYDITESTAVRNGKRTSRSRLPGSLGNKYIERTIEWAAKRVRSK